MLTSIVAFCSTSALVLELLPAILAVVQPALAVGATTLGFSRWFAIGLCLLASGFIWHWTSQRGMASAPLGWRIATGLMLTLFFAISVLGLLS